MSNSPPHQQPSQTPASSSSAAPSNNTNMNNTTISLIDDNNNFRTLSPTSTTPLVSSVTTFDAPETMRGTRSSHDDDHDDLASITPQQQLWNGQPSADGHVTRSNKELNLTSPYSTADIKMPEISAGAPVRAPVVPAPLPDTLDSTYSFISHTPADELFDALSQTLALMGAETSRIEDKPELQSIRYDSLSQTVISLHINLFKDTRPPSASSSEAAIVVEVQRRQGPIGNFDIFYHTLTTELRSLNAGQFNGKALPVLRPFDVLPLTSSSGGDSSDHELDRLILTKWRAITSDRIRDQRAALISALAVAEPTLDDLTQSLKLVVANMKNTLPQTATPAAAATAATAGAHTAPQVVDIQRPYLALLLLNTHILNNTAFVQSEELHQFMTADNGHRHPTLIDQLIALLVSTRSHSSPSLTLLTAQTVAALSTLAQSHYAYALQSQPILRERLAELAAEPNINTQLRQNIHSLLTLF